MEHSLNNSRFPNISDIAEAVDTHPSRWEDIPLETALSLPVPSSNGDAMLFFIYPIGGPIDNRR